MTNETWRRGHMTFTIFDRTYQSKKGETPSRFIARILKDWDQKGASWYENIKEEMEGRK